MNGFASFRFQSLSVLNMLFRLRKQAAAKAYALFINAAEHRSGRVLTVNRATCPTFVCSGISGDPGSY